MNYKDTRYDFSFGLPEGWRRLRRWRRFFWGALGMEDLAESWVRFSRVRWPIVLWSNCYIDISAGPADSILESPEIRAQTLRKWLADKPNYTIGEVQIGVPKFDGEENVVTCRYRDGTQENCQKISVVHGGLEYAITCKGEYQEAIQEMQRTFQFKT